MIKIMEDLRRIDEKKKKIDDARPLPAALVRNLQEWFAVEFTYTSNAIEGNTFSSIDTAIMVEKGITIGGKTIREHFEIINHARAIDFIEKLAQKKRSELTCDDILAIHKITIKNIDDASPLPMIDSIEWLYDVGEHPVIVAARAHYKLMRIHHDTTACPPTCPSKPRRRRKLYAKEGRTARLLMNLLLLQCGYPLAIIKKEQRPTYIKAIEHARKTEDYNPFYEVIIQAVEYTLDSYLHAMSESEL